MKNILYILGLVIVFSTTLSCEDFIDNPPEDQISVNDYFKTSNDIENYVKKYYAVFPIHGSALLPISENNSDNLIQRVPNSVLNGTRAPSNGQWINDWDDIRSINILFDNLVNITDELSSYQQYLGEAHFFRAWFYYNLLRTYGDLPIYDTQLLPDDERLLDPRSPRTEVADFILSELDKAIGFLGARTATGNSRLNKETALAFKLRVALFEGSWQKYHKGGVFATEGANPNNYFQIAVSAGEELINGNYTKGLYNTGNPDSDYYELFGMDNMSNIDEVLFYRIASSSEQMGHDLQFYTTRRTRDMSLTWSLASSYLGRDGDVYDYLGLASTTKGNDFLSTIAQDVDPRFSATIWTPGDLRVASANQLFDKPFVDGGVEESAVTGFQVKKYSNPFSPAAGEDFGGRSETGYILFRYGEVLLNYAEAKYELDGTIAADQLNLLRERVGMPPFTVIPQSSYGTNLLDYGYAIDDALYAIRNERRVELALEGHRIDDYKRWAAHALFKGKRPLGYPFLQSEFPDHNTPVDSNGLIDFFQNELPNGYGFRENQDYLSPIPQDELVLNPNLTQNPGW